jgi:hypothetical protein
MARSFVLLSLLAVVPNVLGHGFLRQVTINGTPYLGNIPNQQPNASVIRQIADISPVKGANNTDLNCGLSAKLATDVASANPGDVVVFTWKGGDLSNWPHNTGPLMTYLASCGDTTCDKFDSLNASWFKINQMGRHSNGTWIQQDIMQGSTVQVTIPNEIAPGPYLMRHEIIALHLAVTFGGAEFYPSCTQLNIGGSGTAVPDPDELVTFPGGYSDNDPGIFDPNVFDTSAPYTFPGPPIAKMALASSSSDGSPSAQPSGTATMTSASTPTATGAAASGTCRLKKRTANVAARELSPREEYPRHFSRVMRDVMRPQTWH